MPETETVTISVENLEKMIIMLQNMVTFLKTSKPVEMSEEEKERADMQQRMVDAGMATYK